jgi:hypothetical protein
MVLMPVNNLSQTMEAAEVVAYSLRLYLQGALKEEENLIRKIQKNRLKKSKKQPNNEQLAV